MVKRVCNTCRVVVTVYFCMLITILFSKRHMSDVKVFYLIHTYHCVHVFKWVPIFPPFCLTVHNSNLNKSL